MNEPSWTETETYGEKDWLEFSLFCNDAYGWINAKKQGDDYAGLGFLYKNKFKNEQWSTYITLEEAKDLHEKIGQYIKFMEE